MPNLTPAFMSGESRWRGRGKKQTKQLTGEMLRQLPQQLRSKSSRSLRLRHSSLTFGCNLEARWDTCAKNNNWEAHRGEAAETLVPACSVRAQGNSTHKSLHPTFLVFDCCKASCIKCQGVSLSGFFPPDPPSTSRSRSRSHPSWAARRLIGTCEQACLLKKQKNEPDGLPKWKKTQPFQFDKFHYISAPVKSLTPPS